MLLITKEYVYAVVESKYVGKFSAYFGISRDCAIQFTNNDLSDHTAAVTQHSKMEV